MRWLLIVVILLHGLIHLMGFAKAFRYAELAELKQPITRPIGALWLLSALAFLAAGILFMWGWEGWWWIGLPAVVLSQVIIVRAWSDAKFGTLANLILLVPLAAAAIEARPASYGNQYRTAVQQGVARYRSTPLVTEADLAPLPEPVQRYLRYTGAVGKPRIHNFRAVFTGDFRSGLKSCWMRFGSEQYNFFDEPPSRLFLMKASMFGLPAAGLHLFRGDSATMQIKIASLVQAVDARGPQMNQSETVTLFNDLCLMAPSELIDRVRIQWETVGPLEVQARYTRGSISIGARLTFGTTGELVNFVSNDRLFSTDGKIFVSYPWSTPVRGYRDCEGRKLPSYAEIVWHTPEGEFNYGRFTLVGIAYNLSTLAVKQTAPMPLAKRLGAADRGFPAIAG